MSQLIVVGFKQDMYRASEVLNKLSAMNDDWVVDLRDAVAVYRDYSGKLRVDQSYQMTTGQGAGWGGFWGALIGATINPRRCNPFWTVAIASRKWRSAFAARGAAVSVAAPLEDGQSVTRGSGS